MSNRLAGLSERHNPWIRLKAILDGDARILQGNKRLLETLRARIGTLSSETCQFAPTAGIATVMATAGMGGYQLAQVLNGYMEDVSIEQIFEWDQRLNELRAAPPEVRRFALVEMIYDDRGVTDDMTVGDFAGVHAVKQWRAMQSASGAEELRLFEARHLDMIGVLGSKTFKIDALIGELCDQSTSSLSG
jgi:hypothetical protein